MIATVKRLRNKYRGGLIGMPSLFVIVLWFAIWCLWSFDGIEGSKKRTPSDGRLICADIENGYACINPMDMIRTSYVATEMDGPSSVLINHYEPSFKPLERTANLRASTSVGLHRELGYGVDGLERGYVPLWPDVPVFRNNIERSNTFILEMSGNLKKYGFYIPENIEKSLKIKASAWQVVVYVATDDNGHVEHVFIEKGADDPQVDQAVIRAMYRGRLVKEGRRIEGDVTVSFSGQG